jgi:hypothetical protein
MFSIFDRKYLFVVNEMGKMTEFSECICQNVNLKNSEQDTITRSRLKLTF